MVSTLQDATKLLKLLNKYLVMVVTFGNGENFDSIRFETK